MSNSCYNHLGYDEGELKDHSRKKSFLCKMVALKRKRSTRFLSSSFRRDLLLLRTVKQLARTKRYDWTRAIP